MGEWTNGRGGGAVEDVAEHARLDILVGEVGRCQDGVRLAQYRLDAAMTEAEGAGARLPEGKKTELITQFYWQYPDLSAKLLSAIFDVNPRNLFRIAGPLPVDRWCPCGGQMFRVSRSREPECLGCRELQRETALKRQEETSARWQERRARAAARLQELREMPYQDYLQSPEWGHVRQMALSRAKWRCQLCNAAAPLQVHHRTYERLGRERAADLIALCGECHSEFHDRMELSK